MSLGNVNPDDESRYFHGNPIHHSQQTGPFTFQLQRLQGPSDHIAVRQGQAVLHLAGVDLLDGTPVLDIKPYLPYADRIMEATGGFAPEAPTAELTVDFSPPASAFCAAWSDGDLRELIAQILRQDPRPAYQRADPTPQRYGMKLYNLDVRWEMRDGMAQVTEIVARGPGI